ncbi:MAG: hypothetical protein AB8B56_06865 [Crocinitomicaceae bacterium]
MSIPSCGYEMTEEDKFPDMVEFPVLEDSTFQITQFPNGDYSVIGVYNDLLYVTYRVPNPKGELYTRKGMFAVLNKSYEEVKSIELEPYNIRSDVNGNMYKFGESSLQKFAFPSFESEEIENLPKGTDWLWTEYADTLDSLRSRDIDVRDFLAVILKQNIANFRPDSEKSYIRMETGAILFFDDDEFYLTDHLGVDLSDMKELDDWEFEIDHSKKIQEKKLFLFDDAKLKNESTGNHYTFGFYQSGFQYFDLVMKGDTARFKFPCKHLSGSGLEQVSDFNQANQVLLLSEEGDLFLVEHE